MSQVAIIIAAYHAEDTIARAVRSALMQPEVGEVIVVDDASRDETAAVAQSADDGSGRLKVLRQSANAGPSAARNRAIADAKSPWVTVLDADDYLLPGRIAGLLKHAEGHDIIADDLWREEEGMHPDLRWHLLHEPVVEPRPLTLIDFVEGNITRKHFSRREMGFLKPLMRVAFLQTHGLCYRESMRLGEDYELYARALALGAKARLLPVQGYVSVVHLHSLSHQHSIADLEHLREADKDLMRIAKLTKDERSILKEHYNSVNCRLQWRRLIHAKKTRNVVMALSCFSHAPTVSLYLLGHLVRHFTNPPPRHPYALLSNA